MPTIEFTIPWNLEAKQGDRVCRIGKFIRHYQPSKVTKNAEALTLLMAEHRPATPWTGPVSLLFDVQYPWLKGHSAKFRDQHADGVPKSTKPDIDNLYKQLGDCLQAAGFVVNDAQIATVRGSKRYGDQGQIWVKLSTME